MNRHNDQQKKTWVWIPVAIIATSLLVAFLIVRFSPRSAPSAEQPSPVDQTERMNALLNTSSDDLIHRIRTQLARSAGPLPRDEVAALTIIDTQLSEQTGILTLTIHNGSSWELAIVDVGFSSEAGETPEEDHIYQLPSTGEGLLPQADGTFEQIVSAEHVNLRPYILSAKENRNQENRNQV